MKTAAQKISSEIHKNSHLMDVQEVIELQEKLTEVLNIKLQLRHPIRVCDAAKAKKYANENIFKAWHKSGGKS